MLRLMFHPPVPDGNRALKLGLPPVSVLAFSTLPRWARRMYGRPSGPLSEMAATAGSGCPSDVQSAAAVHECHAGNKPRRIGKRHTRIPNGSPPFTS